MDRNLAKPYTPPWGIRTRTMIRQSMGLAFVVTLAVFVACLGVNLPVADQLIVIGRWDANIFEAAWRQHNEHRLFFPFLLMRGMAELTNWNIWYELGIIIALVTLCYIVLTTALSVTSWGAMIVAALLFSLAQWENLVWGLQIQIWMMMAALFISLYFLTRPEITRKEILYAAWAAFIGTFSFGNGILIWLVGAIVLLRRKSRYMPAFLALGAITLGMYLIGYTAPKNHPNPLETVQHLQQYGLYVLRFLGSPIDSVFAPMLGAAGLAIFAILSIRQRNDYLLALGLFAIGSALLIGAGRSGFGDAQALSSRYVTLATPLWLANALNLLGISKRKHVAACLILIALIPSYIRGWQEGSAHQNELKAVRAEILATYPNVSESVLLKLHPKPWRAKELLSEIHGHRLSLFAK